MLGLATLLLIVQWGLPVIMPLDESLLQLVGTNVNWIIVVTLLAAMVLFGIVVVPTLDRRSALLLLAGVVLDQGIGELVFRLDLPIFLDTIGSVLVGALLGPTAGVFCATLSCSLWIFIAPVGIPFSAASIVTGWLAGVFARLDGFSNWLTMMVSGVTAGLTVAIVSSPLTYVLENSTAPRADFDIYTPLAAVDTYFQVPFSFWTLIADPIDKVVVFSIVFFLAPWVAKRFWGIDSIRGAVRKSPS